VEEIKFCSEEEIENIKSELQNATGFEWGYFNRYSPNHITKDRFKACLPATKRCNYECWYASYGSDSYSHVFILKWHFLNDEIWSAYLQTPFFVTQSYNENNSTNFFCKIEAYKALCKNIENLKYFVNSINL
jgi:hypothetical protein